MSDKATSLAIGALFLVLVAVLYTRRRALAGTLCGFMYPAARGEERARREVRLERLLRILLGIYLPALTLLLMLVAVMQTPR